MKANYQIDVNLLNEFKEKQHTLVFSEYFKNSSKQKPSIIKCILDDLPISELKKNAERIYKEIFHSLNDTLPEITFNSINKWPLETDILFKKEFFNDEFFSIFPNIYLDLIYQMISDVNVKEQYDYETPIEEQMRSILESGETNFKEQVRYEGLRVDFEVYDGNKKVFVECDGKQHQKDRDDQRDLILEKYAPVLHFTGREIYSKPDSILKEVKGALDGGSKGFSYDSLDEDQEKAVKSADAPTRVIATAGAGKTRLLKNRILHLLDSGVSPAEILVLSFNKKNKDDLIKKLKTSGVEIRNNLTDQNSISVQTFHSFCYKILKKNLPFFHFDKERNEEEYDKLCLSEFNDYIKPHLDIENQLMNIKESISKSKNELNPPQYYEENISSVVESLMGKQREKHIYTFDDMQYLCFKLLLENKNLREIIQKRFSHVLVDEFQDLSLLQIKLLDIISPPQYKIYITGDDDQLIYRWRGSNPKHILTYLKDFNQVQGFFLRTNYRCPREIIRHSKFLIENNKKRIQKEIIPYKEPKRALEVLYAEDIHEEVKKTVSYIKSQIDNGIVLKDIVVITRYHEVQYFLAFGLNQQNIPFKLSNVSMLLEKKSVQIILSYLKVIFAEEQVTKEDWGRVFSYPMKNIEEEYLESFLLSDLDLLSWFSELEMDDNNYKYCNLKKFVTTYSSLYNNKENIINIERQIEVILETFDLYREFKDMAKVNILVEQASDEQIVELLKNISKQHENLERFFEYIENVDVLLNNAESPNDCINFYTIHGSKGMEFPHVVFFHTNSLHKDERDLEEIEEDRRMYYVAATRATNTLCITQMRNEKEQIENDHNLEFLFNPKFMGLTTEGLIKKKEECNTLNNGRINSNSSDTPKLLHAEEIEIYEKRIYNLKREIDLKKELLKKRKIFILRNKVYAELVKLEEDIDKYTKRLTELKNSDKKSKEPKVTKTLMKVDGSLLQDIDGELESRIRYNFNNYVK